MYIKMSASIRSCILFYKNSSNISRNRPILQQIRNALSTQYDNTLNIDRCIQEDDTDAIYEVSKEDFKYVEKLMPQKVVPEPPEHPQYPTPSGWYPQSEEATKLPYFIHRTKNHMFPVYPRLTFSNQHSVKIRRIDGDIWMLEADLRKYLEEKTNKKMTIQVQEIGRALFVKGEYSDHIVEFMKEKGF